MKYLVKVTSAAKAFDLDILGDWISALVINFSGLSKHAADEGAMPWVNAVAKLVLSFFSKVYDAKQDELQRLPPQAARKKLPPPNKPDTKQPESSGALDDEIPF